MPPIAPAAAAPPAISGPRTFVAAAPTVSVTELIGPAPLLADDPFGDDLLAAVRAVDLRAVVRRARVEAALLAAAERDLAAAERARPLRLLGAVLELVRERGVDAAMGSPLQESGTPGGTRKPWE